MSSAAHTQDAIYITYTHYFQPKWVSNLILIYASLIVPKEQNVLHRGPHVSYKRHKAPEQLQLGPQKLSVPFCNVILQQQHENPVCINTKIKRLTFY